mgnify:CR=1 FL=1
MSLSDLVELVSRMWGDPDDYTVLWRDTMGRTYRPAALEILHSLGDGTPATTMAGPLAEGGGTLILCPEPEAHLHCGDYSACTPPADPAV